MPAFLRFSVLVLFLSASVYSADAATFKYGRSKDESIIKQPSRLMRGDLSGHVTAELSTPDFLHPDPLRSSKLKQQQIRAERIKRNMNTKTNASNLASTATPVTSDGLESKTNGSAGNASSSLGNNTKTNASNLASTATPVTSDGLESKTNGSAGNASSSLGKHGVSMKRVCGETPNNQTNNTTSSPCQGGFLPWKPIPGQEDRNPCVKRIVRLYFANREEIVTELECRKATIYCRQTSGGMGRCQPIKVQHSALGKIVTVGCKCKS